MTRTQFDSQEARKPAVCLFVGTDIHEDAEAAFNEWYDREHLASRVIGVPGVMVGRHLIADLGRPRHFTLYESVNPDAFLSGAYLRLVKTPDANSRQFIPYYRNTIRTVAQVLASLGNQYGGTFGVVAMDAVPKAHVRMKTWLAGALPQLLIRSHGILRTQTLATDRKMLGASSRIHTRADDQAPDFVVIFEGASSEAIDAMRATVLSDAALSGRGARNILYARARLAAEIRSFSGMTSAS